MPQGTQIIRTQSKKYVNGQVYTYKGYQHFTCWLENAEDWFNAHPYIYQESRGGGRPALEIDDCDRKARHSTSVKASLLRKKKKEMISMGLWENARSIDKELDGLKLEYEQHGGVPHSSNW